MSCTCIVEDNANELFQVNHNVRFLSLLKVKDTRYLEFFFFATHNQIKLDFMFRVKL